MLHCMIDVESLGTQPGSVMCSLGAVAFDASGIHGHFYQAVSIKSCLDKGLVVDAGALKFWLTETSNSMRAALFEKPIGLKEALHEFDQFWQRYECKWLWAHGSDFDIPLLSACYAAAGYGEFRPWKFRDDRDTRTLYSLVPAGRVNVQRTTEGHHALRDAEYQAQCVIRAYELIGHQLPEV